MSGIRRQSKVTLALWVFFIGYGIALAMTLAALDRAEALVLRDIDRYSKLCGEEAEEVPAGCAASMADDPQTWLAVALAAGSTARAHFEAGTTFSADEEARLLAAALAGHDNEMRGNLLVYAGNACVETFGSACPNFAIAFAKRTRLGRIELIISRSRSLADGVSGGTQSGGA